MALRSSPPRAKYVYRDSQNQLIVVTRSGSHYAREGGDKADLERITVLEPYDGATSENLA